MCWFDWDTLHILRVGRSVPNKSRNPYKSRVKIQLLTRIGLFGPVWRVSKPVWPRCRSSWRRNFSIRTANWTSYIYISIISMRSTQWCSPIDDLTTLSRLVWLVRPDCPAQTLTHANFGCQQPRFNRLREMHVSTSPANYLFSIRSHGWSPLLGNNKTNHPQ